MDNSPQVQTVKDATGDIAPLALPETEELEALAKEIEHLHVKASLQIGERLARAQQIFRYQRDEGGFTGWIEGRLKYSVSTAYRLIDAYKRFGDGECFPNWETLPTSAFYLLAAPSTPEDAVKEVAARIGAGEKPSCAEVQTAIKRAKCVKNGMAPASEVQTTNEVSAAESAEACKAAYAADEDPAPTSARSNELLEYWQVAAAEEKRSVLKHEGVDALLELLKGDAAFLSKLYDRVIGLQVALASPAVASKSSKNLLTNLTGTLHWALGQDDPASGAQALKIIKAKLTANKRDPKDICFSFAKTAKR